MPQKKKTGKHRPEAFHLFSNCQSTNGMRKCNLEFILLLFFLDIQLYLLHFGGYVDLCRSYINRRSAFIGIGVHFITYHPSLVFLVSTVTKKLIKIVIRMKTLVFFFCFDEKKEILIIILMISRPPADSDLFRRITDI